MSSKDAVTCTLTITKSNTDLTEVALAVTEHRII